jgi:hypothetical protein
VGLGWARKAFELEDGKEGIEGEVGVAMIVCKRGGERWRERDISSRGAVAI